MMSDYILENRDEGMCLKFPGREAHILRYVIPKGAGYIMVNPYEVTADSKLYDSFEAAARAAFESVPKI